MGFVALIMGRMSRGIRTRKPRPYILICIGAGAILRSVIEIVDLARSQAPSGRRTVDEADRLAVRLTHIANSKELTK